MTSREQTEKLVADAKKGNRPRQERFDALSAENRKIVYRFLGLTEGGRESSREDDTPETALALLGKPRAQRDALLTAIYGELTPHVIGALELNLPYGFSSYSPKPFRVPDVALNAPIVIRQWLSQLATITLGWNQSLEWFALHCTRVQWGAANTFAPLFAAAIDAGDPTTLGTLQRISRGEHELGVMDDHVIKGLLMSSNADAWASMEKLLIAAQRQEGVRQSIFNAIPSAHPTALRRMLRVILENDLLRFSSSVQFLMGLLPILPAEPKAKELQVALEGLLFWLENDSERGAVVSNERGSSPLELYLALWSAACDDALRVVNTVETHWLDHDSADHRFVAVRLLGELQLEIATLSAIQVAYKDEDLRVVTVALNASSDWQPPQFDGAFEMLEGLLTRVPKTFSFTDPLSDNALSLEPERLTGRLVRSLGSFEVERLLPHWANMNESARRETLDLIGKRKQLEGEPRRIVFTAISDPATYVRQRAFEVLEQHAVAPDDAEMLLLEGLLSRKRTDVRKGVIRLILRQPEAVAAASAERLSAAKNAEQRAAGAEIGSELRGKSAPETVATLNDGLGLFNPEKRAAPITLEKFRSNDTGLMTQAALECVQSLHELVKQHALTPLKLKQRWNDEIVDTTLGEAWFPNVDLSKPFAEQRAGIPMLEVWEAWLAERPASSRDADGFELLRAIFALQGHGYYVSKRSEAVKAIIKDFFAPRANRGVLETIRKAVKTILPGATTLLEHVSSDKLKYANNTIAILYWLVRLHPVPGAQEFVLRGAEHSLATVLPVIAEAAQAVSPTELKKSRWQRSESAQYLFGNWTHDPQLMFWYRIACDTTLMPWNDAQLTRNWQLTQTLNHHAPWLESREWTSLETLMAAWRQGAASETDVLDHLIGLRSFSKDSDDHNFSVLTPLTARKASKILEENPILKPILERVVSRILEVECGRGDLPTAASAPAMAIKSVSGAATLMRLLTALGKTGFVRGYISSYRDDYGRADVFSHLIRASFPAESDNPEAFAALAKQQAVSEQRLLELGLYAPQWARFVAHAVEWDGAADAMWWLHAHTKDTGWGISQEVRDAWKAEIAEQTPLTAEDLLEGAVDVRWFGAIHQKLGDLRWKKLYEAAKYASSGTGHTRSKLFADAMLGRVTETDLLERVRTKRYQDGVRAIGLLPLEGKNPAALTLSRYKVIQEFVRSSKKAGGQQKQASEALAARIGMQNLARSAGYADPTRLTWAMELDAVQDLRDGPLEVTWDGVLFKLEINPLGEPELEMSRAGKILKDIPASLKKNEAVVALRERKKELERQVSRMRLSLETAMIRNDAFSGAELVKLFDHPMLRVMMKNLVWMLDGEPLPAFGFPEARPPEPKKPEPKQKVSRTAEIGVLYDYNGSGFGFGTNSKLRIAHPHDLFTHQVWSAFQTAIFDDIFRVQPFKQLFREFYPLTAQEQDAVESTRYAGHQVNPKQSIALLAARGWVSRYEEGVSKTFFDHNITAWVESNQSWTTPAEVEAPTLERVYFTKRGDWKHLKLSDVPAKVFSETMRDIDLVVSVAHVGGVDPEASQSTVEMRGAMVLETARLLKLENVRVAGNLVMIEGQRNHYTVHLGSGTVHQQPGGFVCIVAVPSQERGRVFLPFADNDPRTAEVVAKTMLLSKDNEIIDPIILRQIA